MSKFMRYALLFAVANGASVPSDLVRQLLAE